jgi:hypothetical protein
VVRAEEAKAMAELKFTEQEIDQMTQADDQTWPVAWIDPEDLKALQDGCRVVCNLQPCDYGGDVPLYASPDDEQKFLRQVMEQRDSLADAAELCKSRDAVAEAEIGGYPAARGGVFDPDETWRRQTGAGTKYEVAKWTCPKCRQQRSTLYIDDEWCHGESFGISYVDGVRSERCGTCARKETAPPLATDAAVVGYMVHGDDIRHAAMYPLSQSAEAFDAARRWKCCITALAAHPSGPALTLPVDEPVDVDAPQVDVHLAELHGSAPAARSADSRSLDALDAARYRWLRDHADDDYCNRILFETHPKGWDVAIDAAIAR